MNFDLLIFPDFDKKYVKVSIEITHNVIRVVMIIIVCEPNFVLF